MSLTGEEAARAIADPHSIAADEGWERLLREVLDEDARHQELVKVLTELFGSDETAATDPKRHSDR